jgi:hypothetical protein
MQGIASAAYSAKLAQFERQFEYAIDKVSMDIRGLNAVSHRPSAA